MKTSIYKFSNAPNYTLHPLRHTFFYFLIQNFKSCCSVTKSCTTTPWDPMDCSTPGFPVPDHLPELAQIHVYWVVILSISSSATLFSFCLRSFPNIRVFSNELTLRIRCTYLFTGIIDLPWGVWTVSCGMWNLVPWLGITPGPPALGTWSLSHWTARKFPLWGARFISKLRQRFGESCVAIAGWTLLSLLSGLFYKQSN